MDKLERLLTVAALIQSSANGISAEEIRESTGAYSSDQAAFHRTFERDKRDLLDMGVPLTTIPDPDEPSGSIYRSSPKEREIADPRLTPAELAALRSAAVALVLQDENLEQVADAAEGLRKLGGLSDEPASIAAAEMAINDTVRTLFEAIVDGKSVSFRYRDQARQLIPRQIVHRSGHWYLRATSAELADDRTYRVDRIQGPVLVDAVPVADIPQDPLNTLRMRPWEFGGGDAVTALVSLDAEVAPSAFSEYPDLPVRDQLGDGTTVVELEVRNPDALSNWLVGFLHRAELIEPPDLRAGFIEYLEALAAPDTVQPPAAERT